MTRRVGLYPTTQVCEAYAKLEEFHNQTILAYVNCYIVTIVSSTFVNALTRRTFGEKKEK